MIHVTRQDPAIPTVPISDCAVTSATFIEDAYRKAVSGALTELGGEQRGD
jgi:hypothetical protein